MDKKSLFRVTMSLANDLTKQYLAVIQSEKKFKERLNQLRQYRIQLEPKLMDMLMHDNLKSMFVHIEDEDREQFGGYGVLEIQESVENIPLNKKLLTRLTLEFFDAVNELRHGVMKSEDLKQFANTFVEWIWTHRGQRRNTHLVRKDLEQLEKTKIQKAAEKKKQGPTAKKSRKKPVIDASEIITAQTEQIEAVPNIPTPKVLSESMERDLAAVSALPFWQIIENMDVSGMQMENQDEQDPTGQNDIDEECS